jgi:prepilin-type N-terminal cleavage/methylation domain-containing protein
VTRTAHDTPRQRGFTILEVLLVAVLIVILAAVAIPAIGRWLEEYRLGIATQQVADSLQMAKMRAVAQTRKTELLFDVAGNRLGVEGTPLVELPGGVRFDAADTAIPPDTTVEMIGPVTFPALPENGELRAATFTGRGLPDVEPGEDHAVFLTNTSGTRTVIMTSAGNIRVLAWEDGKWR